MKIIRTIVLIIIFCFLLIGCDKISIGPSISIITYEVSFDSRGGSAAEHLVVKEGSKIHSPRVYKEGYKFLGWYTSLDGGETLNTKWVFTKNPINEDLVLYADWEEIFPIISFYSNGGSQVSKIVQRQGEAIEAPIDPIREGYDFAGWYSDQDLENYFIFDKMPKVDITLYADWGTEGLEYILLSEDTYGVSKGTCLATSVKIPKRHMGKLVTNIVDEAFSACDNLENIVIPPSVTSIGTDAFRNCTSLTSITIPNSVTNIGAEAFYNCESIIFYAQVESKPEGWDENFNLYNRPVIWGYISNDITTDGYEYGVSLIDSVYSVIITRYKGNYVGLNIPEKIKGYDVKEIGNFAFSDCNNLMNVRIPSTVTSIGIGSFSSCVKLSKIIIPSTVTNIGAEAFYNCESIIFYAQATTKPEGWDENFNLYNRPVIWGCISTGYTEGYLEYLVVQNGSVYNVIITKYSGSSISLKIPEKIEGYEVIGVGEKAFNYCTSIISIKLPDSITSIGAFAFNNCTKLVSINMPTSLTSIGEGAFRNCNKVIIANLPNGVTKIEKNVFENCSNLTSIVIPATVTSIGEGAFRSCVS
ncbi:MAG: leucine-rich repeat protein, partial [Bacilli bacterium]|nr:leucine-rich repeat protein [Bacilli bacterium]